MVCLCVVVYVSLGLCAYVIFNGIHLSCTAVMIQGIFSNVSFVSHVPKALKVAMTLNQQTATPHKRMYPLQHKSYVREGPGQRRCLCKKRSSYISIPSKTSN